MCARLFLAATPEDLAALLEIALEDLPAVTPRYNIAPGQDVFVARHARSRRVASLLRWGLVPRWSADPAIGHRLINARAESADRLPAFRDSLRDRRCLVPMQGFYEWRRQGAASQPYAVHVRAGLAAVAGLWDEWQSGGRRIETFTLLTTAANDTLAPIHDRMPVILEPQEFDRWLDPAATRSDIAALLRPCSADTLAVEPVGPRVNRADFDDPSCLAVIPPEDVLPTQSRLF